MRIPLPNRKYSFYTKKQSLGQCEVCQKLQFCYEVPEGGIDDEGHPTIEGYYWTCKSCLSNENYEKFFN